MKHAKGKGADYGTHANLQFARARSGSRGTFSSPDRFVALAAKACRPKKGKAKR